MSAVHPESRQQTAIDAVAGLLATAAIAIAVIGVAYRPARLTPVAILLGLVAARMSYRWRVLAGVAVATGAVAWVIGMTIAVLTSHPMY